MIDQFESGKTNVLAISSEERKLYSDASVNLQAMSGNVLKEQVGVIAVASLLMVAGLLVLLALRGKPAGVESAKPVPTFAVNQSMPASEPTAQSGVSSQPASQPLAQPSAHPLSQLVNQARVAEQASLQAQQAEQGQAP